jgi:hypothetical protein
MPRYLLPLALFTLSRLLPPHTGTVAQVLDFINDAGIGWCLASMSYEWRDRR